MKIKQSGSSKDISRIVCIDIGNTSTKFGYFVNGELVKTLQVMNSLNLKLPLLRRDDIIVVASVNEKYRQIILNKLGKNSIFVLGEKIKLKDIPMKFNYENINTLGKDRICFAFYSHTKFKKDILNVSCGTALVIDYIDKNGVFQGGVISAGPTILLDTLQRLDRLKNIKFTEVDNKILGRTTNECVSVGIINSIVQLIMFYVKRTNSRYVVISGGCYKIIEPSLRNNFCYIYEPNAVILGLYSIFRTTLSAK